VKRGKKAATSRMHMGTHPHTRAHADTRTRAHTHTHAHTCPVGVVVSNSALSSSFMPSSFVLSTRISSPGSNDTPEKSNLALWHLQQVT